LVKLSSTILKDKVDMAKKYEKARELEQMAEEEYEKAVELVEQWATHMKWTEEEAKQNKTRWRDAIPPCNINFDGAAHRKTLATPIDNMQKVAKLLANDDDKVDLEYLGEIVGTAMKQQSEEDILRRLASNPESNTSTATTNRAPAQQSVEERRRNTQI
jgi:hypothetical protein